MDTRSSYQKRLDAASIIVGKSNAAKYVLDQTFRDIVRLLPYMPYYGEFNVADLEISDKYDKDGGEVYITRTFDKEEVKEIHDILCGRGYAVRRYDIKPEGQYIELTDLGRKLKESGTIHDIFNVVSNEYNRQRRKEDLEETLLENYVYLTTDQRKKDKKYRGWTLAAAIFAAISSFVVPLAIKGCDTNEGRVAKRPSLQLKISTVQSASGRTSYHQDSLLSKDTSKRQ